MQHLKKYTSLLLSKLIAINTLIILLVILLAALTLKDYACYLVNGKNITGAELVHSLNIFLVITSVISLFTAGMIHFLSVKKIVKPIKDISYATKEIKEGHIPPLIEIPASGELKELTTNFNNMVVTLSTIQNQRENMLKDIAHELRTPLTNINGYLEALQNGVIDGNPKIFGSLLEESQRITRIVELISELNSWEKGIYFLEKPFTKVNVSNTLKETLIAFQLKLEEQFHKKQIDIDPIFLNGNQDGLRQAFTNILQNIIDYNTGNDLWIEAKRINKDYVISFTHTGEYIAPDKQEFIFDRFYRMEESRSRKAEGAGLGLTITKRIVEAHNGEIWLKTNGNRHTFYIRLPFQSS
ncbi:HAMP domain-containing histidine kinase [Heyndrickxia oleronia]|uniref:sensor histidine kinase n=1 Tax=Heyndrickxia oleronia TaxID=38875 RepID=UPI00203F3143|nr:HAMP domain-containing sensor histidine kinase [Heyndrickxia oleronia]MCM3238924.1 HAMP domain-containing histidine kinase [Heyndrickxia oleronia]